MSLPATAPARRGRPRKSDTKPPRAIYDIPEGNEFPASGTEGDPFAGLVLNDEAPAATRAQDNRLTPAYRDDAAGVWLYHGNCLALLDALNARYPEGRFDAIFADPPYFLSNGGVTCHAGRMVRVDKGDWDKSQGPEMNHEFNRAWLERCQRALKPNGTLWVTGTHHVIFSIGYAMQQLGFKILNDIAWEKPNPPPNLSCRYFTHSTETVLWAAKNDKSRHVFNYLEMKQVTGKQMKTVWRADNRQDSSVLDSIWTIGAPGRNEKMIGRHPTQKPIALIERCLRASTHKGDLVLDPFAGSGTAALAALRLRRKFVGIEIDPQFLKLSSERVSAAGVSQELSLSHG